MALIAGSYLRHHCVLSAYWWALSTRRQRVYPPDRAPVRATLVTGVLGLERAKVPRSDWPDVKFARRAARRPLS
jgi:hypothetical protein